MGDTQNTLTERATIHVAIDKALASRIDDLRHASQSRTDWINRALLWKVTIAETAEEGGKILG